MSQQIGEEIEKKNNAKLELIINNNQNKQEDGSIDLMGVFRNMKNKRGLYLRLIAVFVIIGLVVPLLMHQMNQRDLDAIAVISFTEGNGDTAPDGRALNVDELKSNVVIANALNNVVLSKNISITQVAQNISIERLLTKETRQRIAYVESIKGDYTDGAKLNDLLSSVEYKYGNQFVITLKNGFGSESGEGKKTYIKDSELTTLLKAVVVSYSNYMFETYENYVLPANILESMDISKQEYNVVIDHLNSAISSLKSYCDGKAAAYPGYRSETDGLSFADIGRYISLVDDINLTSCSSFLYENGISRNYNVAKTQYEYNLTKYELSLNETVTNIATVERSIEEYKSDIIKISGGSEGQADRETSVTSDYYKGLINERLALYSTKSDIEKNITEIRDHISKLSPTGSDAGKIADLESKINMAYANIKDLYNLVCDHTVELFETGYVRNHYLVSAFTTSDGTAETDGITSVSGYAGKNESLVKNVVIGVAAGAFLAVVIWVVDAFAEELKKSHKEEEA